VREVRAGAGKISQSPAGTDTKFQPAQDSSSFVVYGCMGRKIEIQESVNKNIYLCQAVFAPMARAMPAIP